MDASPNTTLSLRATLHDGSSARAIPVLATPYGERLVVRSDDDIAGVPMPKLRRGIATPAGLTLHRIDLPDWRLILHDVPPSGWAHDLRRVGRLSPRSQALYIGAAVLLAAVGAAVWTSGNEMVVAVAPLVPYRVTEPIGRSLVADMGRACMAPAGRAALSRMVAELTPTRGFAEPLVVTVVDVPVVNAVAVPGGHVVIFRRLIEEAASPDEVAGVLAHEFGHVDRQHPNQALIREMGVSLLARSLGGNIGGVADLTLLLHGTRAAEAEADGEAIGVLRAARISPAQLAGFFDRQAGKSDEKGITAVLARLGDYADSHPSDASRAARFRGAALANAKPALSPAEWQALRTICGKPSAVVASQPTSR